MLLEKLRSNKLRTDERKLADFEALAKRVAAGESVPDSEAEAIIDAAGRTIDALEEAVAAWKKRFGAAPLLAEEARLRQELPHTHDALPALEAELAELTERVKLARQDATNRQTQINQRLRAIHEQKRQIEAACRDHAALARLKAAREKLANVSPWLNNLRSGLRDIEGALRTERAEIAAIDARADALSGHAHESSVTRRSVIDQAVRGHENDARELRRKIEKLAADEAVALKEVAAAETVVYAVK